MNLIDFDSTGYKKRTHCMICGNEDLAEVLSYGKAPLAGEFLNKEDLGKETLYPLAFLFCEKCYLFQTDGFIHPDILFKDYRYLSSVGLAKHFSEVSNYLINTFGLNSESCVLDIGSNDGVLLKPLLDHGVHAIGIDPAINVSKIAVEKGCPTINDYFNKENAEKYFEPHSFDLVTCCNCFAHIEDIHEIIAGVKYVLKHGGAFVIEVHYMKNLIDQIAYDNLYAEHIYEYSLNSLKNLFSYHDMTIVDYEEIPVHAGSIRVVVKNNPARVSDKVLEQLAKEQEWQFTSIEKFNQFSDSVYKHADSIHNFVANIRSQGHKVVGYGASGRANMLAHLADLSPDLIDYIVDESPERYGRYLSRTHIAIYNKEYLDNDPIRPDYIFIFAWNFSKMIINKLQGHGYKFIVPFPSPMVVESSEELELATL